MKVAIGCDHGAFELKEFLKEELSKRGYEILDKGTFDGSPIDYPLIAFDVANSVASKEAEFGILACTSAEGVTIAANKVKGIRAGIGYNDEVAVLLRKHNDANIITFAGKFMEKSECLHRSIAFLNEPFEGGRHARRVNQIIDFEK